MFGEADKKLVFIGGDHRGFKPKKELVQVLKDWKYDVTDLGSFNEDSFDYPDIAREVAEKVQEHPGSFGVLICGSGNGVAMVANKLKGIRAALAVDEHMAEMTRKHNDANILTLGSEGTDVSVMKKIVEKFLKTEFEKNEERHVRRVEKINAL